MMMQPQQLQLQESSVQKNSLFTAMDRFLGAVNNMDQTVMVPSLLRDVPLDEDTEMTTSSLRSFDDDEEEGDDMYSYYQLLKSIRQDIQLGVKRRAAVDEVGSDRECGFGGGSGGRALMSRRNSISSISSNVSSLSSMSMSSASSSSGDEDEEDEDLRKQFQYHLTGLQGVLSKLTVQANSLTKRYKKEIGMAM